MLYIWALFALSLSTPTVAQLDEHGFRPPIPTYFIDPNLLKLTLARARNCGVHFVNDNRTIFALEELAYLSTQSASEYFRGHELLAYHYFVENRANNPHYREYINDAEMEYIPILPLAWKTQKSGCSYSSFITMLLKINEYMNARDAQVLESEPSMVLPRRFFVASSFNMRTQWGSGMPTPYRKGTAWESMSAFVQSLSVGHYERWPECPDLLRKWWKYVVEIPFLTINSVAQLPEMSLFPKHIESTLNYTLLRKVSDEHKRFHQAFKQRAQLPIKPVPFDQRETEEQKWYTIINHPNDDFPSTASSNADGQKQYTFFFAGHFELPGPELVCSTRNSILNMHYERSDLLLINLTSNDAHKRGVIPHLSEYMARSVFCIIAPGDSYSSSLFYHAIANGCLPIVINDWFVFAYPWLVHYEAFVFRIAENNFNLNPSYVLDTIKSKYFLPNPYLIRSMQRMMKYFSTYLLWQPVEYMTDQYYDLLSADVHYFTRNNRFGLLDTLDVDSDAEKTRTLLPLELMMLEMRYETLHHNYYRNVPCMRPLWCNHDYESNATHWLPKLPNPWAPVIPSGAPVSSSESSSPYDDRLPSRHGLSASLFPAKAGMNPPTIKVFPFTVSVLRKTFERYRGMPWTIFPTAPSIASDLAAREEGWWVKAADFFQVHALYIPPPSVIYHPSSVRGSIPHVNDGIPEDFFEMNRRGQRQIGVLATVIPDRRPYICQHRPRLIGIYKIVFYMQCVRVLWTLTPGKFKPKDNIQRFTGALVPLPSHEVNLDTNDVLSREEYDFTLAFHNVTQHPQPGWVKENFPLASKHSSYFGYNHSEGVRLRRWREESQRKGAAQLHNIFLIHDLVKESV